MQTATRLRFRLFALIIPLVVTVVFLSGVFSSLQSRSSLTRLANRHLAYKAEQLRDYFFSEWRVITQLGFDKQDEYRKAATESFESFAYSLLRSGTEAVYIFDAENRLVKKVTLASDSDLKTESIGPLQEGLQAGWFSRTILGEARIGVAFSVDPFGWMVAFTDMDDSFFSDARSISISHAIILAGAIVVVILFLSIFVGRVVKPLESLTRTMREIGTAGDLNKRVNVEFDDEIGYLAGNFNEMLGSLSANYRQLELSHLSETAARQLAVEREEETLLLLSRVSDVHDEETGAHLKRIGTLSAELSKLLGHDEAQQKLLFVSAPLHDIGKIGVPESIILKTGKLTPEEYEVMKKHTIFGHELLKDTKSAYLAEGATIALTHHEKWDGTGYPRGLKAEEIPLSGRIVGLVDVFDALTSERPYKKAWSPEDALAYMIEQKAKHFDPYLIEIFQQNFQTFRSHAVKD